MDSRTLISQVLARAAAWVARPVASETVSVPVQASKSNPFDKSVQFGEQVTRLFKSTSPQTRVKTRWEPGDDEKALQQAEGGNLQLAAQMVEAMLGDGVVSGVLSTRTQGLIRLPLTFEGGSPALRDALQGVDDEPGTGVFWHIFPERERVKLLLWGIMLGVGIAEFVAQESGSPKLHVLEPQFLQYRWAENQWYYLTLNEGLVPVCPGDGRWVMYFPYGEERPWLYGAWRACAFHWLQKQLASLDRGRWSGRLANGILWVESPQAGRQTEREGLLDFLLNMIGGPVTVLPEGWKMNLLESTGRGFEVWSKSIEDANREIAIALSGQTITTFGTSGFSNGNIHDAIKSDLIQSNADSLAECLRTQGLMRWAESCFGFIAEDAPYIRWDTSRPDDMEKKASAMSTSLDVIAKAQATLGDRFDLQNFSAEFGVPLRQTSPFELTRATQRDDYPNIDWTPPKGVQEACAKGVAYVEQGYGGDGLQDETVSWARRLAKGQDISPDKAVKMNAWFARHSAGNTRPDDATGEPTPGWVAWLLWGGDAGQSWSAKLVRQMNAGEQ